MKKLTLITGGTSGIGFEVAKRAAAKGQDLYLVYRSNHDKASLAEANLAKEYPGIQIFKRSFDLSSLGGTENLLGDFETVAKNYRLDSVVSCHGQSRPHLFLQKPQSAIIDTINEHLISNVVIMHRLLPKLCVQSYGRVVFMTSLASHKINRGQSDYALSKGALEIFVKSMVSEYGHRNITFNCISAGFADTHFTKDIYKDLSDKHRKVVVPVQQIADLITFLTAESSTHTNGSVFRIDGGQFCLNNNFAYHTLSFHNT